LENETPGKDCRAFRFLARGAKRQPAAPASAPAGSAALAAPARAGKASGSRKFFDGRAGEVIEIPLYRREDMAPGATIAGPAVIAEDETSTFVSNSFDAHIDGAGSIVMERKAA